MAPGPRLWPKDYGIQQHRPDGATNRRNGLPLLLIREISRRVL